MPPSRARPPGSQETTTFRLLSLEWLLIALVALVSARAAAAEDPGFCQAIQDVVRASRTDFSQWRGKVRDSVPTYDAKHALPRASDCRIERIGDMHYTCEWAYGEDEGGVARAAEATFLEAILDCLGHEVQEVRPVQESKTGRRQTTLLVAQDDPAYSAELRVSSGRVSRTSTWYVEFSANRRK
jgi:hypothetical protein